MKELTKAEEQVMQYLWEIEKGFLKDIIEKFPIPKPAYTTVSTVVRVLVKKKNIGFNSYGKVNEYYPLISKEEYRKVFFKDVLKSFFNNSPKKFASFFTKDNDLSLTELEEIKSIIESQINKQKSSKDE